MKLFYSKEDHCCLERKLWLFEILVVMICLVISSFAQSQNLEFAKNIIDVPGVIVQEHVTTDASGNIFVAGRFYGDESIDFDPTSNTETPPDPGTWADNDSYFDLYVAKYNASGDFQWVIACYTTGATAHGQDPSLSLAGIITDASGNLYIAGDMTGGAAYWAFTNGATTQVTGQSTGVPASDWTQPFVVRVNSAGERTWVTNPNAAGTELELRDIELYGTDVYVVGRYNGEILGLPDDGFPSDMVVESCIVSFDQSDGSFVDSERLLHTSVATSYANEINALEIDGSGNLYVVGTFKNSTDFNPGAGSNIVSGNSDGSSFLAKYNSSFAYQWVRNEDNVAYDVKRAPNGYFWVVRSDDTHTRVLESWNLGGNKSATVVNLTYATNQIHFDSNGDIYTWDFVKIDGSNGTTVYDHDLGKVAYVDDNDKVYVTANYENLGVDFDVNAGVLQIGSGDFSDDVQLAVYNNETDVTPPTLVAVSPVSGSTEVDVATNLVLTFNEPVRPMSNTAAIANALRIRDKTSHSQLDFVLCYSDEITYSGNTITIDLADDLPDDTEMYIRLDEGFVIDYASNEQAAITSNTFWEINTGAAPDVDPPVITAVSPLDEATDVSVFTDLVVTFDEDIQAGTGNIVVRRMDNNAAVKSVDVNSAEVTITGNQMTVDLPDKLLLETNLYVQIIAGVVEDLAGNPVGAQSGEFWDFTTEASSPPQISALSPADDAGNVSISGQTFTITWDEPVFKISGYIRINEMNGTAVEIFQNDDITVSGNQTSFTSTIDLDYNTDYYITINYNSFQDAEGSPNNTVNSTTAWNFTTEPEETVPPAVTALSPADDATAVPINTDTYTITFSEDVQVNVGTSQIWLYRASDDAAVTQVLAGNSTQVDITNNVVTIEYSSLTLASDTEYYIVVLGDAFEDLNGNAFAGIAKPDWSFSTSSGDVTPPTISALNPTDNATNVAVDQNLVMTFNENVIKNTGSISVHRASDDLLLTAISVGHSDVVVSGSSVSINLPIDLPNSTELYVNMPSGTFQDVAGNDFGGISDQSWSFTTEAGDVTAPTISSLSPAHNATGVSVTNWVYVVTFDENIQFGSGLIRLKRSSDDATITTALVNTVRTTISGAELTIDFNADGGLGSYEMAYESDFYIEIPSSAIEDLAGNAFAGTNSSNWLFTTEAEPFALVSLSPADNSTEVSVDADLSLTFNQDAGIGAGNIQIFRASDDVLVASLSNYNGTYMTISGPTITFDFPSDLPMGEDLYINVSDGYLRSDANPSDTWTGFADETSWNFTTADPRPQITGFTPTTTSGAGSIVYEITFDRDIALTSLTNKFLRVFTTADQQVVSINRYGDITVDGNTATIRWPYPITPNENYYVLLTEGMFVDASDASNGCVGIDDNSTWTFSTSANDGVGPNLVSLSPANGEEKVQRSGLNVAFSMTFDEPVYLGGTNGEVRLYRENAGGDVLFYNIGSLATVSEDHLTVTFDIPDGYTMLEDTEYYILLDATDIYGYPVVYDADGNGIAGISDENTWRFRTYGQPQILSMNPADEAVDVAVDQVFTFTTNNDLTLSGGGTIRIRNYATGGIARTIVLPSDDVTVNGNEATFHFNAFGDLSPNWHYYIDIASAVFIDEFGQTFSVSGSETWDFVTGDAPPIEWDGSSWSNGSGPTSADHVLITGHYNGGFECTNLTVNAGVELQVDGNGTLEVNGDISNSGGITILSGSSLITYDGNSISGNDIEIRRNTRYSDGKYSFVGTPVESNGSIVGADLGNVVYSYDESVPFGADGINRWLDASAEQLVPGKGYAQAFQDELVFTGIPNSGTITYSGSYTQDTDDANEGWNLVSNPFAAAIDVDQFLTENTNILGAIYLWDDNNSQTSRGDNADYVVANAIGVTSNSQAGNGGRYNNHILSSQGFFVQFLSDADTDLDFTESMRVTGNNADANFFREEKINIPQIKLSVKGEDGFYRETLIGRVKGITDDQFNRIYDAPLFDQHASGALFSVKLGNSMAIQGISQNVKTVDIGLHLPQSGTFTIAASIAGIENPIYLLDQQTDQLIQLGTEEYQFTTSSGSHKDRFQLILDRAVVNDVPLVGPSKVYTAHKDLIIQLPETDGIEIQVLNVSGKVIYESSVNANVTIPFHHVPDGLYIVREIRDGFLFTHKVMFN